MSAGLHDRELGTAAVTPVIVESREAASQRRSVGVLLAVVGVLLLIMLASVGGDAQLALSDAFDEVQLPTLTLPGFPVVLGCAVVCLAAAAGYLTRSVPGSLRRICGAAAGIAVLLGFITWAAAGRDLPFLLSNQFAGTIAFATPLVLGALCGVLCERAGVVNVSIEGQFLTSAFVAAVVGSITQSIPIALIAAVLAGVVMSVLLALFALTYVVNQVVLGVVLNLLAAGLTGFLFDQLVQPNSGELNAPPLMAPIPIPLLSQIPFLGRILFNQTALVYLAAASVIVVWWLLFRSKWGLRVRAVGEHPEAADTVGISVNGIRWAAVLLGGVFAGLGGSFFTIGYTGAFIKDLTVGNGFIALAALIMGRWHPVWAALMALFFGFITQLASQTQTLSTPLPSDFLLLLPYVATIIAVAGLVGRVRAPAADGIPYEK